MSHHRYFEPKDYDAIVIGSSGFEYTCHTDYNDNPTFTIRDSQTKETLFTLKGGNEWQGRGMHASNKTFSGNKTILGKDEKYYYIATNGGNHTLNWGIVQTSGIVLREDRSVLTTVKMHPLYDTSPEIKVIPTYKPIVPVEAPIVPTNTGVVGVNISTEQWKNQIKKAKYDNRIDEITLQESESWLMKIINWIRNLLDRKKR